MVPINFKKFIADDVKKINSFINLNGKLKSWKELKMFNMSFVVFSGTVVTISSMYLI